MWYFTGKGDEGEANLFDGRRLPKSSLVFDLIGTLDEATAQIGLAVSLEGDDFVKQDLESVQDDLSKLMGVIAGAGKAVIAGRFDPVEKVQWLENHITTYSKNIDNPGAFIYAGTTVSGAAVDVARTVIRKAERLFDQWKPQDGGLDDYQAYLNRLSSFLYVLRLFVDNRAKSFT